MIKTAVITGGHHFDVVAFHHLFRALPGIDVYLQHMEDFVMCAPDVRAGYDVLIFYTHLKGDLAYFGGDKTTHILPVLESLAAQGIVMLHHSLVAFPGWKIWDDMVGMADRDLTEYRHDEAIPVQIADPDHPVTAGLTGWTITDETYLMPDAGEGNHILLTTPHPHSMATLAWTRHHQGRRVCCIQLGHDSQAWEDANFQKLLAQAIGWCAG